MLDNTAILAIQHQALANTLSESLNKDADAIALPENFKLHDMERFREGRRGFRGQFATTSLHDFSVYCERHEIEHSTCFIDAEQMSATTVMDIGDYDAPGHCNHIARITMQKTAPYKALLQIANGELTQQHLAEWLEDWRDYLTATSKDGSQLPIKQGIAAIRKITIEAARKEEHTTEDMAASRSSLESIEAKSEHTLPSGFEFTCTPYHELAVRTFRLRLSILTGGERPKLRLRLINHETDAEEMAEQFKDRIAHDLSRTDIFTFIGTFNG